ncbi:H/ACA ribonucleoprotein complex subunit 2-like protein [Clavelina lepadiformis]|uniref:H/ACA ribonucleoprotein complex subunit 2-like protein n=1 Tax=Clavelina lepadiformis TaxID=159417 RepID=UPI0040419864
MGKVKSDSVLDNSVREDGKTYEELLLYLNPISKPLASKKLTKRLYKCIKKASKQKNLRRGVKEVQKFLKKGEKGFVVFAGDTRPIEVMCHIPIMCEDTDVPYCYIPAKQDLGAASGSKRPTCCIMVKSHSAYEDVYKQCMDDIKQLPAPY